MQLAREDQVILWSARLTISAFRLRARQSSDAVAIVTLVWETWWTQITEVFDGLQNFSEKKPDLGWKYLPGLKHFQAEAVSSFFTQSYLNPKIKCRHLGRIWQVEDQFNICWSWLRLVTPRFSRAKWQGMQYQIPYYACLHFQ